MWGQGRRGCACCGKCGWWIASGCGDGGRQQSAGRWHFVKGRAQGCPTARLRESPLPYFSRGTALMVVWPGKDSLPELSMSLQIRAKQLLHSKASLPWLLDEEWKCASRHTCNLRSSPGWSGLLSPSPAPLTVAEHTQSQN